MPFDLSKEIAIEKGTLPSSIYHIVPIDLFFQFTDINGLYDPRNQPSFGGGAPFIHATLNTDQIMHFLAYFKALPLGDFYLIEVHCNELEDIKLTYANFDGRIYPHIWGPLSPNMYSKHLAKKISSTKFILNMNAN